MAKKEIEVIGVDFSEDMLIEAQSKLEDFDGKIAPIFIHQDIRELDLYGTVDSAVCSLDGINHIPEEDLNLVFGRVSLFMEPGGVFIFDINTPEHLMNMDGRTFVDETDDVFCVWRGDYYKKENCCVFGMDIFSRQENGYWLRDNEEHVEYLHSLKMLADKLQKAGFCSIQVFSELELLPPREDAARVFFAAQKSKRYIKYEGI